MGAGHGDDLGPITMSKSCGEAATHRRTVSTPLRLLLIEPWKTIEIARSRARCGFLLPMWIEERFRVEFDGFGDQAAVGVVGRRLMVAKTAPRNRSAMRAQGHAGTTPNPPPPPFSAQNSRDSSRRWRF